MAFSPGMGLSFGQGAALYVGLIILILIGPTAFATPPVLRLLLSIALLLASVEAVTVPNAKATLFDTNPRLDVADDLDTSELELDGVVDMCKFLAAGV